MLLGTNESHGDNCLTRQRLEFPLTTAYFAPEAAIDLRAGVPSQPFGEHHAPPLHHLREPRAEPRRLAEERFPAVLHHGGLGRGSRKAALGFEAAHAQVLSRSSRPFCSSQARRSGKRARARASLASASLAAIPTP